MKLRDFPDGAPFKFVNKTWPDGPCIAATPVGTIKVTSYSRRISRIYVNHGDMFVVDESAANAEVEAVAGDGPKPVAFDIESDAPRHTPYAINPRPLNKERYYHIPIKDHPRVKYVTVYAKEIDGIWYSDVAYCAKGDNFSRPIGRAVARNRFQHNRTHGEGMGQGRWGTVRPTYEKIVWWANHMAREYVK